MKKGRVCYLIFVFICLLNGVYALEDTSGNKRASYIHRAIKQITDVMVYDIYSPPVTSRTYAYVCIAGYEAGITGDASYRTLAGQLHGLKPLPAPPATGCDYALAAVHAILTVGKALVISEEKIDTFYNQVTAEIKRSGLTNEVYNASIAYGTQVAKHILSWAAEDNYKQTRTFSKYSVIDDAASWKPTPPAYMKAVEPHWNKIRTFIMDSARLFQPLPATPFSMEKNSRFYSEALAVRDIGLQLTDEQKEIANFWDCNPFKMNVNGHVMFASKKISPGGHWMNITKLACEKVSYDFRQSLHAYACLSIAIADAFISCWDEKYRSLVIRPETYINQYIDAGWLPLLQTPPFPEYTSGHSVISNAAAVILEKIFGDHFSYADSTEVEFGIPVRHFRSFRHAADEAAISRFYGGIHYMPSIINGSEEGKKIGSYILSKINTGTGRKQNAQSVVIK